MDGWMVLMAGIVLSYRIRGIAFMYNVQYVQGCSSHGNRGRRGGAESLLYSNANKTLIYWKIYVEVNNCKTLKIGWLILFCHDLMDEFFTYPRVMYYFMSPPIEERCTESTCECCSNICSIIGNIR